MVLFQFQNSLFFCQDNVKAHFLKSFKQQNVAGKVQMFDTLQNKWKLEVYPFIKHELDSIYIEAKNAHNAVIVNKLYQIEGVVYYLNKNFSKAIPIFKDLLAKRKIRNYKDSALIYHYLKESYVHVHSLNKAIEVHRIMEPLRKKHPDINPWMFHPRLSTIYYEMKLYSECLTQQLVEYNDIDKNDRHGFLSYYNNRGLFWSHYGNSDSALKCFQKARTIFETIHLNNPLSKDDQFVLGLIEGNIGQAYMKLNMYEKAIPLLKKDIQSSLKSNNILNAAVSETELAKCYMNLKQFSLSKQVLDSANFHLKNIDDYKSRLEITKQYANYYDKIGVAQTSISFFNKYITLRDSFEKEQNIKDLITTQVENQISEKEELISENQKKIESTNKEVQRALLIRNSLITGGVLLIIIIIIITYQLVKAKAQKKLLELKNKQIKTRNRIISKSLDEKDLLVKEVHHRVKNNLQIVSSLLKLQTLKTTNKDIQGSLNEAQERINSMAILHQLLYKNNQMTRLSFKEYLGNLVNQISSSFTSTNKRITVNVQLVELELDIDTAIPLGLITNEIMSNAFKHAFKGEEGIIDIELKKQVNDTYSLKISDNGVGIPANFDIENIESLGLDIVSILSEQINAELKIYNQNGAHFEIIFKAV